MKYNLYITCSAKPDSLLQHTMDADGVQMYEIELSEFGLDIPLVLEAWDNVWTFVSRGALHICKQQRNTRTGKIAYTPVSSMALTLDSVISATIQTGDELYKIQVVVQEATDALYTLNKYRVQENGTLLVGSADVCTLVYKSRLVQQKHFTLQYVQEEWVLQTAKGAYVWVNGVRISGTKTLKLYDTVVYYNLRICCMRSMCAINTAAEVKLQEINQLDMLQAAVEVNTGASGDDYYLRTPRMLQELDTEKVSVERPPAKRTSDKTPWLLSIGPSMTMMLPMMAAMMINMYVNSSRGASPLSYLGICISMGMSSVFNICWALGRKKWQKKQDKKYEAERLERYTKYLEDMRAELAEREQYNRDVLAAEYLATAVYVEALKHETDPHLWTMNSHHNDYGTVRIGTGVIKNLIPVDAPREQFTMEDDDLLDEVYKLRDAHEYVANMPVVFNLRQAAAVGVVGSEEYVADFARALLVQVAHTYSYVDVKVGICADAIVPELLDSRFMPHTFTDDGSRRLFAYTTETLERLVGWLTNIIKARTDEAEKTHDTPVMTPLIIVFCYTRHILDYDAVRQYIDKGTPLGVTFVLLFGKMALLPNGCRYVIENDADYKGAYAVDAVPDTDTDVTFEALDETSLAAYARRLGRFVVQEAAAGVLPNSVDFLSLLGIGNLSRYDLRQAYRKHDTSKNIRGLLGMGHNGVAWLDIHEKQAGPHGLVAGMTGSGKSELLQTLILSWALSYSPDELAFVLIDYKGGGMANIFAGLPHTAGVITNLSEEVESDAPNNSTVTNGNMQSVLTVRALTSIKAEIKHRQAVFKAHDVNHIDAYIQLYKHGQAKEPLPHLIIIVDEFAELRKEQHNFITDLVSAARVGRSLGVHLILATQKPAGVVDDEIWSNTRFRACLRVQDKQDSMGMLHRPEAAYLTQIGRMYLQVGVDEIFEEVQCAYTGAAYIPTTDGNIVEAQTCEMVQLDGATLQYKPPHKTGETVTQLDACISYIDSTCVASGIHAARKLWLPVLPRKLVLSEIQRTGRGVFAVLGLIDDVVRQQQTVLTQSLFALSNCAILGAPGCGKTTMLQTILYDLTMHYTPDDVQFYVCDYSSGILKAFEVLPHCGGVLNDAYTSGEKVLHLLQLLRSICDERRRLFDEAGVSNCEAYCKVAKIPTILFVIDNFALWAQVHEAYLPQLLQLLRESPKYGIQVVMTFNSSNELKFNWRSYIQQYYTLTLPDSASYRDFCGISPSTLPPKYKGRGLIPLNGALAEFQIALTCAAETEAVRNNTVREELIKRTEDLRKSCTAKALEIPMIPYGTDYKTLVANHNLLTADAASARKLFVGYNVMSLGFEFVDLMQTYLYMVSDFTDEMAASQHFMNNMLYICTAYKYKQVILNPGATSTLQHTDAVTEATTYEQVLTELLALNTLFTTRADKERPAFVNAGNTAQQYQKTVTPYIVYIPNVPAFVAALKSTGMTDAQVKRFGKADNLDTFVAGMFKSGAGYGVHFILGCNKESYKSRYAEKVYDVLLTTKTFIHFGGALNELKNCTPHLPMAQQTQVTEDITDAYTSVKNADIKLWIP